MQLKSILKYKSNMEEKSGNKYHNSPFERGVGVCYNTNIIYFLIFLLLFSNFKYGNKK